MTAPAAPRLLPAGRRGPAAAAYRLNARPLSYPVAEVEGDDLAELDAAGDANPGAIAAQK